MRMRQGCSRETGYVALVVIRLQMKSLGEGGDSGDGEKWACLKSMWEVKKLGLVCQCRGEREAKMTLRFLARAGGGAIHRDGKDRRGAGGNGGRRESKA